MESVDHGFWATMTVNFYSNETGKGVSFDWSCLFFFNDRLFPCLLKLKLNIIAWTNASDSFEKPFSERSIPSKIKLNSIRSSIGTDSVWQISIRGLTFQAESLSYGPYYVYQWLKKSLAILFWMLFWTAESKINSGNLLSNPGTPCK